MAYQIHNVSPGDLILSRTTVEQDTQIAANETAITQLSTSVASNTSAIAEQADEQTSLREALNADEDDIEALESRMTTVENGKVSKPTTNPNGTSGQLLRTNGDGTTTWVDQGLPTDAQTAEAVSAWLDEHPEATTTVADGAITYNKLDSELKAKADDVSSLKSALTYIDVH